MEGKIKWSLSRKGLQGPTPKFIARRIDIWSAIFGVLTVSVNSAPFINATQASSFSWFLGMGTALLQAVKPFYSVQTTETEVPIEDVEVMDTHKGEEDGK